MIEIMMKLQDPPKLCIFQFAKQIIHGFSRDARVTALARRSSEIPSVHVHL